MSQSQWFHLPAILFTRDSSDYLHINNATLMTGTGNNVITPHISIFTQETIEQ